MSTLSYTHNLVAGTPENINHVMTDLNDAKTVINGGLDTNNLSATAGIVDTQLASPNNASYRTLQIANAAIASATGGAAHYWIQSSSGMIASGASIGAAPQGVIRLASADYAVGAKTTKLRLRAICLTNPTAPAITATAGLYPLSGVGGGAGIIGLTLGTVVTGSTVAFASQAANTIGQGNSGDFTIPADGQYLLGIQLSGTAAVDSLTAVEIILQQRNT